MSDSRNLPAASGLCEYRDPAVYPPPRGCKLLLLTSGGVAAIGDWTDDSNLVAWAPLPRKPRPRGAGREGMTRDEIIRMARDAGSIDSEDVIETVYSAFSTATRKAALDAAPEQEPVALCDPAEYDDFQGAVSRNRAAANSPKRHAPVTMETVYETIIHWDEGGGKRSRRELARRIVDLYTRPPRLEC